MDLKLRGKVALVTGSSRGIGLATAKAFAAEGCRVMLSARSTEQLREAETALRAAGAEIVLNARAEELVTRVTLVVSKKAFVTLGSIGHAPCCA
jgi:NAD(P)-dependent dehydrogenase (short-subunit alcohol dehydrogenase family)